jgi:hypothetical protein
MEDGGWRMADGEWRTEDGGWRMAAWQKMAKSKAQQSGVDHREICQIRENGAVFVRVFRVVRGEKASFLSLLSLFAANQPKCLSMNHLRTQQGFCNQVQSSLIKANQVIFFSHSQRPALTWRAGLA